MKRPSSYTVETICTWLAVAAFFALAWRFPHAAEWLFSPFRDHLGG